MYKSDVSNKEIMCCYCHSSHCRPYSLLHLKHNGNHNTDRIPFLFSAASTKLMTVSSELSLVLFETQSNLSLKFKVDFLTTLSIMYYMGTKGNAWLFKSFLALKYTLSLPVYEIPMYRVES